MAKKLYYRIVLHHCPIQKNDEPEARHVWVK